VMNKCATVTSKALSIVWLVLNMSGIFSEIIFLNLLTNNIEQVSVFAQLLTI